VPTVEYRRGGGARNLTGDPGSSYLVEFVDPSLTLWYSRGRRPNADAPASWRSLPREPENGLEFVVAGSAQRSTPGMLRVNMRITDAATTEYLWAGRHEFRPEELAPIQTKITRRISRELHVLALQEASRRAAVGTGAEFGINECLAHAKSALSGAYRAEHTAEGQRWFLAALARDPRNTEALVGLARTCQQLVSNPWWGDPRAIAAAADLGREAVAIALALAPGHAFAKCTQGMLYSAAGQLEEAARAFEQALAMDQGLGIAHGFAGYNAALLGRAGRPCRRSNTGARTPRHPLVSRWHAELLGRNETAIIFHQSLQRNLELRPTSSSLAAGRRLSPDAWRKPSAPPKPSAPIPQCS
jgi:tetratricopeptide (TPR) repeat protein